MTSNDPYPENPSPSTDPSDKVAIVTDSVAQIPVALAQQTGISVVPFTIVIEGRSYLDGVDLEPNDLYQQMRQEKDLLISTSGPSIGQFYQIFTDRLRNGSRAVLYVGLTGRLSGAVRTAQSAAKMALEKYPSREIVVFDSRLATIAQGFLAMGAARLAEQGASLKQILAHLEEQRQRTGFAGGLESLEYLARGGRIGKAAYMISSAAQILPVLAFNSEGEIVPISRVFGYPRVLEAMIEFVRERAAKYSRLSLAVMHADALVWAEKLFEMAQDQFQPDDIFITDFTPVMAAHSGPGIIGLAFNWQP